MIPRLCEWTPCFTGYNGEHMRGEVRMTIQSSADGGTPEGHFAQGLLGTLYTSNAKFNLSGIPAEFLSKPHRGRVLQMGSPNLDNTIELASLPIESTMEAAQRRQQLTMDRFRGSDVNGSWNDIVARLAEIDVIVGMDELAASDATEQFGRTVGNHFVGIHVRRGA